LAYDEGLAQRIRGLLKEHDGVDEKKMFGGLAFMRHGNMFCGVAKDDLMVRVGAEAYEGALARPHAHPMDFTGRPMRGMVFVGSWGCATEKELKWWVEQGLKFVGSIPAKKKP